MAHRLRAAQKDTLVELIQMAASGNRGNWSRDGDAPAETGWKVLVYDEAGRDVIAPLLKVFELRDLGVTLHMMIDKQRQPVPGVPAIYLCEPSEENIARIAKDATEELYQSFFINFLAQIPRRLLEALAEQLASLGAISHIRVFDRTLHYVAETNDYFHLLQPGTFRLLNSSKTTDREMEACLQRTVQGICHVLQAQQILPVVAHISTGAAQEVAGRLTVAIGDLVREQLLPPTVSSTGRPLLLIVDRSSNLQAALHHPFTYRGQLIDTLGMKLNKVALTTDGKEKTFVVDGDTDAFFHETANLEFGVVGDKVEEALAAYNRERSELASGGNDTDELSGDSSVSRMLASAPRLTEVKKSLDTHTSLGMAVLQQIRNRALDMFNELEKSVLKGEKPDFGEIATAFKKGTLEDRQRLFLVIYLVSKEEDLAKVEKELLHLVDDSERGFPALNYIKRLRQWSRTHGSNSDESSAAAGWRIAQGLAGNIAKSLKGGVESVFAVTRLVDALLQDAPKKTADRMKLLESVSGVDPRTKQSIDLGNVRFSHCIVFSLGGGSVAEFDELKEWEARNSRKFVAVKCSQESRFSLNSPLLERSFSLGLDA